MARTFPAFTCLRASSPEYRVLTVFSIWAQGMTSFGHAYCIAVIGISAPTVEQVVSASDLSEPLSLYYSMFPSLVVFEQHCRIASGAHACRVQQQGP